MSTTKRDPKIIERIRENQLKIMKYKLTLKNIIMKKLFNILNLAIILALCVNLSSCLKEGNGQSLYLSGDKNRDDYECMIEKINAKYNTNYKELSVTIYFVENVWEHTLKINMDIDLNKLTPPLQVQDRITDVFYKKTNEITLASYYIDGGVLTITSHSNNKIKLKFQSLQLWKRRDVGDTLRVIFDGEIEFDYQIKE